MRYTPSEIENKWQKKWLKEKIYEPDLKKAKRPFYNLMMFPYPSAEGLHVGNMYAFTGADIYGRFKRMQGYDVFEPIGLDGFGIHSENYALKTGKHPADQAKISEKNFYRQLQMIGNGFAWRERLETYDPEYYKWTQWIFIQMFKRGLAYRQKASVNWCPKCLTVLADEQVLAGECERCGTAVVKKELEQWFFKITDYAERLLKNLEKIDWPERIKVAQRNWIGRSEGAEIEFEIKTWREPNFVLLHGYKGAPHKNFFPWLKIELERRGYKVQAPTLPHTEDPKVYEQVSYVLQNTHFDSETVVLGHSLGVLVALKTLEKLKKPVRKTVLVGGFMENNFLRGVNLKPHIFDWKFDVKKIRQNAGVLLSLRDLTDDIIPAYQPEKLAQIFGGVLVDFRAEKPHACGRQEPAILGNLLDAVQIFTTRPDTLFGATYIVLAPEHPLIKNLEFRIKNLEEVNDYLKKAKAKTEEERIAEGREKTGVELKGIKAINPANGEEIPVWVADYVLGHVGTGAIMAVPAHDERDLEFAKRYNLPIRYVVSPQINADSNTKGRKNLTGAYTGQGTLINSGKFTAMDSEKAKWEITKFVGGKRQVNYRLRDWLISRQRYWGPPIPIIYCCKCWESTKHKSQSTNNAQNSKHKTQILREGIDYAILDGKEYMIHSVAEKDLPVRLPYLKEFRPTGTDKSPLATVEKFWKVRCPKCKNWARRETDVSDTFLDSAWYYLGYLMKFGNWKLGFGNSAFTKLTRQWLPVAMYIGGAEHAVLHLLYSRFLAMAFHDWGLTHFEEPFKKFRAHGLLIKDGAKMSKSRGNVVNPDEYIRAYGADALRMYLMFLGPFEQGGDFRDTGIRGITRFLERVWKFVYEFGSAKIPNSKFPIPNKSQISNSKIQKETERIIHKTIKKVTEDIENLQYNTAISALMTLLNEFEKNPEAVSARHLKIFLKLLAPFAPFITEELYNNLRVSPRKSASASSIHLEQWPRYDPKLLQEATFELVIQVNGKVRGRANLPIGASEKEAKEAALSDESVRKYLTREPRKVVFLPNKLINFVT